MPSRAHITIRARGTTVCKLLGIMLVGAGLFGASAFVRPSEVTATPPTASKAPKATSVPPTASGAPQATAQRPPSEGPARSTIIFATTPSVAAVVTWGRQSLGRIMPGKPLVVVRPRDSGPLDVMVRAAGYLPVQTRAHTFTDQHVLVKLTPVDKKSELLGYRAPIEEDVESDEEEETESNADADQSGVPFRMFPEPVAPAPLLMP